MTPDPVIALMETQRGITTKGGTMRLGAYPCRVKPGTMLEKAYGESDISERHRHRFEFNNDYRGMFNENGMVFCGTSPDDELIEAVEYPKNRFHLGVQFHPEFKSRPNKAQPIFREFVGAALESSGK